MMWRKHKLPVSFYRRLDVLAISRELIGAILVTRFDGLTTAGRIVELEAYRGVRDRASHAWNGRRTSRNEVMYAEGGRAYVYLCYGIHHLFNVVTGPGDIPHAVLIRALEPVAGLEVMARRTGKPASDPGLTRGPGNLTRAMGLDRMHNGMSVSGSSLYIARDSFAFSSRQIVRSPRIGVDYAGPDARLPYRFYVRGNSWVSGKPK